VLLILSLLLFAVMPVLPYLMSADLMIVMAKAKTDKEANDKYTAEIAAKHNQPDSKTENVELAA